MSVGHPPPRWANVHRSSVNMPPTIAGFHRLLEVVDNFGGGYGRNLHSFPAYAQAIGQVVSTHLSVLSQEYAFVETIAQPIPLYRQPRHVS